MRPLIFSTAQPPICMAWTSFIFKKLQHLKSEREHLANISQTFQHAVQNKGFACPSTSHIVPVIIGDSSNAVAKAQVLQNAGFYIMPVRPPTVPQHSSRLRISLTSQMTQTELHQLIQLL